MPLVRKNEPGPDLLLYNRTKAFIAGLITAFEFAPAPEKKIAKINA